MSHEREKLSWREIDQLRGKKHRPDEREPRGEKAKARAKALTEEHLKQADGLFAAGSGGSEGERLAAAVEAARGSDGFDTACREYVAALGLPEEAKLASVFLDSEDPRVLDTGLRGLLAVKQKGDLNLDRGLQARLRTLSQHSDDDVAYGAEDLLA
jgi:hypothetical protein